MRPSTLLAILFCGSIASAAPGGKAGGAQDRGDVDALYQKGMRLYAVGKPEKALPVFKEVLRRDPDDRSARAAVVRIYTELAFARLPKQEYSQPPTLSESIDEFLVVDVPRYYDFGRTFGDDIAQAGTLDALNGRVSQLMAERRRALEAGREFAKERELRSLVRRLPSVVS